MPEDLFGCPSSTRSSADKPVFGASRSRPNFDQQIGLEGRSMPEDLFGCPSSTRSSADKPVFGASRSRPNFDQQIGLEGRSMPEDLFGCPSSTRSSADKPVFGASRSRPNFDQQIGLEGRSMPEDLFGCPSRRGWPLVSLYSVLVFPGLGGSHSGLVRPPAKRVGAVEAPRGFESLPLRRRDVTSSSAHRRAAAGADLRSSGTVSGARLRGQTQCPTQAEWAAAGSHPASRPEPARRR